MNALDKMHDRPHAGLSVTCLVEIFRPQFDFAAAKPLEPSSRRVSGPTQQTCCGQTAYNSGHQAGTRKIARAIIDLFEPFDYLMASMSSCAVMIQLHFVDLFSKVSDMWARAEIEQTLLMSAHGPRRFH